VAAADTGTTTLDWAPVTVDVNGQPVSVTGYRVEYGQNNFLQNANTTGTSYTFTLPVGTWQFRVVALSSSGESMPTNALSTSVVSSTAPPAAPSVALSANPATITAGSNTSLSWSSVHATSCSGVGTATSGTTTVTPQSTTAYQQTCTGLGGTATASAIVTVNPPAQTGGWYVAPNGYNSYRSVYEAVLSLSGTKLIRGNYDGNIDVGRPCGAEVFKMGTSSYRWIANSDARLNSPTYADRSHVTVCVQR